MRLRLKGGPHESDRRRTGVLTLRALRPRRPRRWSTSSTSSTARSSRSSPSASGPTSASSDAQLGFLYGTAFAVFYALFGIPLGRLADVWDRRRLIALGLAVLERDDGAVRPRAQLRAARRWRGSASASARRARRRRRSRCSPTTSRRRAGRPCSRSTRAASTSARASGSASAAWSCERWDAALRRGRRPFGLRGWQVAFFAVGLPGLLLALWVRTLREPVRGSADGARDAAASRIRSAQFARELRAVLPPLTLVHLALARRRRARRSREPRCRRGDRRRRGAAHPSARHAGAVDRARRSALYAAVSWVAGARAARPRRRSR